MSRPVYTVTKNCKYRNLPCGKCGCLLKLTRKYVLSPTEYIDGLPVAYHIHCYQQVTKLEK